MSDDPPPYHRRGMGALPQVTEKPWVLLRTTSKVDTMLIMFATCMQVGPDGKDIYYGWLDGRVDDRNHSYSARQSAVMGRFASESDAKAAARKGLLAWAGHEKAVKRAAQALRDAEAARENDLWAAVAA